VLLLLISIGFFVKAHYESGYEEGKAKSNSLLYIYNADTDKAVELMMLIWILGPKNI
jgi:hypothetical protein